MFSPKKTKKNNKLAGLPVFTQSGLKLGAVAFVEEDEASGVLKKIYVKKRILGFFVGREMVIDKSQILNIESSKVVVSDTCVKVDLEDIIYKTENA